MIPAGHRCPEQTHAFGGPVQCRKAAGHEGVHWALTGGKDVVWLVQVMKPKSRSEAEGSS